MAEYEVELDRFQSFPSGGGYGLSDPSTIGTWQGDGDPATTLTLRNDATHSFDWEFSGDQTAHAAEVGNFRVEVDVAAAGEGTFKWTFYFYDDFAGNVIYSGEIPFSGAGTFAGAAGPPDSVPIGSSFDGMPFVLSSIANLRAAGELRFHEPPGVGDVVISEVRVIFFPVEAAQPPVTRLYPRDDGRGLSSAPRIHPPTKARRIVGGYQ